MSKRRIYDNEGLMMIDNSFINGLQQAKGIPLKCGLIKSESSPMLSNMAYNDNECENVEDKLYRGLKKHSKVQNDTEDMRVCATLRLSHIVIVDSVLKESNIDSKVEALLPLSLNTIYQKFIGDKKYIDQWQAKDEFYRGVGLYGIGIEERIYKKRKILEDSLKRRVRLRPHPKPRRQFDGTIINRPLKSKYKLKDNKVKTCAEKIKYNVFTIGNDMIKKGNRTQIRKAIRRKSVVRRAAAQKLENAKKALNEAYASSDDEEDDAPKSIALSRAKRQTKVPQLDFKYCYNDGFGGRQRKYVDSNKEDQFMEIIDSDSSSVVEVFPPGDKENSEYSDNGGVNQRRACNYEKNFTSKLVIGKRKGWRPRENKALNLLDKLRLGLQCTVIQTEQDIIIQNLTVEDLSTLRRRLQGLATFKNIEAEYDKNGIETARATIDRRVLNLPFKGNDSQIESRFLGTGIKKLDESMKRKIVDKKTPGKEVERLCYKVDDYCSTWVRPKVRSVKKIRKLYTQSASTPNILARSQNNNRSEVVSGRQNQTSSVTDTNNTAQHVSTTPASFYPQITSSNMSTEPFDVKSIKTESFLGPCSSSSNIESSLPVITSSEVTTTSLQLFAQSTITDVTKKLTSFSFSNGTPATAKSASQLLMMRKGCAQTTTADSSSPCPSNISMSRNDQLFANQILKPFKKAIPGSSPSKLEIDDEETDFELTPSIIAKSQSVDSNVSLSCSPVIVQNKSSFMSKPLIQPAGILTSGRRTIHLSHNSQFQTHNTNIISTSLLNSRIVTPTKLPVCDPPQFVVSSLSNSSNNSDSINSITNAVSNNNTKIINQASINIPNPVKIKHRKWTHNFLTSNSINFREVLCAAAQKTVPLLQTPLPVTLTTNCKPSIIPNISVTNITTSYKHIDKPTISVPAKGSSVVLKSLLVGSNATDDLCNLNKSAIWASKYLTCNISGVKDSKIKWQVGGSVVPSQPAFVANVSKENKSLDMVTPTDNK